MRRIKTTTVAIALVAIAGCGGTPEPEESDSESIPSAIPPEDSSEAAAPEEDSSEAATELLGFGASVDDWESVRGDSVPGFIEGSVYGSEVRDGMHKYFAVMADDTVTFYSRGFPNDTSLNAAMQLVLEDFPDDARIAHEDREEPDCVIALVRSRTVREATGAQATASFFSEPDPSDPDRTALDPENISHATVFSHSGGPGDLGDC